MSHERKSSSTAVIAQTIRAQKEISIAMISWNMENKYGGDTDELLKKITVNGRAPDIIVIAGQEEARPGSDEKNNPQLLGGVLKSKLDQYQSIPYIKTEKSYDTRTKLLEPGRVSLTILSKSDLIPTPKIDWEIYQGEGLKGSNKGGVACHMTMGDQKFSFSGMHLDSNYDHLKVEAASAMVKQLEGFKEKDYLTYEMIKNRSTNVDIMMGDLNHRHVQVKKNGMEEHYDPLGPDNFDKSAARYVTALDFKPVNFEEKTDKGLAPNTYNKAKDKEGHLIIPNKKNKRCDGATKECCYAEGTLDRVLVSGEVTPTPVVVVPSSKSDHLPIVSTMIIKNKVQTDFDRTKEWVIRKIKNYTSNEVINTLNTIEDNESGKKHLETVFNYYMNVRNLVLQAEKVRLEPRLKKSEKERACKEYKALMGSDNLACREPFTESIARPGLVQRMIDTGNNVFKNTGYLNDPNAMPNLQKEVTNAALQANKNAKSLREHSDRTQNVMEQISKTNSSVTPADDKKAGQLDKEALRKSPKPR